MPAIAARVFDASEPGRMFLDQWTAPSDVFSVLLLLGGDVINRALAQITGSRWSPVAFSFGWVAYAVTAVTAAVGDNRLLPPADCACKIINTSSQISHENQSWVLGRLMRDFDYWCDKEVHARVEEMRDEGWKIHKANHGPTARRPPQAGLCVAFYTAKGARSEHSGYDRVYFVGVVGMLVQLAVAAIPCGLYGDWSILLITAAGTVLAGATASLSQWSKEKWACGRGSSDTVILTRGQGSQYAVVISGAGCGFDLEDLSASLAHVDTFTGLFTRAFLVTVSVLWVLLLISAAGIHDHTWYLLGVGAIGMLQNIYIAGAHRDPAAFGMPLEYQGVMGKPKVMATLMELEKQHPGYGKCMLRTFFPGQLRADEKEFWNSR